MRNGRAAQPTSIAQSCRLSCPYRSTEPRRRIRHVVAAAGGGRRRNYYDILGIEPDVEDEVIKTAFRRLAKELHPDVNKEEGAAEAFIQASKAYEVLGDATKRAEYDNIHGLRRMNFFRDVYQEEDEYGDPVWRRTAYSPGRPGDMEEEEEEGQPGHRGGHGGSWRGAQRSREGGHQSRDDDEEEESEAAGAGFRWANFGRRSERSEQRVPGSDQEPAADGNEGVYEPVDEAEREARRLEELMRLMQRLGGGGALGAWPTGGRGDPFGASSTDTWSRRVQQQVRDPFGNREGWGGRGARPGPGPDFRPEWQPPGRRAAEEDAEGYGSSSSRPGVEEWRPPGYRQPQDEDDGTGRSSRRTGGWGDGGGFSGTPL